MRQVLEFGPDVLSHRPVERHVLVHGVHPQYAARADRPEEMAALIAGGDWATTGTSSYASAPDMMLASADMPTYNRDKVLLWLERRRWRSWGGASQQDR